MEIPKEITLITNVLETNGFPAYLVGGCVRDFYLGRTPKDWDITTSATPEEIQNIFPDSVYENNFGTVGVKTDSEDPSLKIVEITTFRTESEYSDKRHPDEVRFAKTVEEDLSRRSFTVNAMAMRLGWSSGTQELVDPYGGMQDLKAKIIRSVGDPRKRFEEDALRIMRAARFSTELNFEIELQTSRAIVEKAGLLEMIAKERIRDELVKILMSERAGAGIYLLEQLDILRYVLPELREGLGVGQNLHHIYSVFEHNVRALEYAADKNYSLEIRMASLLHDIGKPKVKAGDGPNSTFYNHDIVGAKMTTRLLDRLKFGRDFIEKVTHLVRYHLFYYNVGEVSDAGVRRFIRRVGPEHIDDLLKLREADRIGSGVPKAFPYRLRHLLFMIDKVRHDPVSPKMLKIDGGKVMEITELQPSPKIGQILNILLEEVIDDPEKNTEEYLENRTLELNALPDAILLSMAESAKDTKEEFEEGVEADIKKKHRV